MNLHENTLCNEELKTTNMDILQDKYPCSTPVFLVCLEARGINICPRKKEIIEILIAERFLEQHIKDDVSKWAPKKLTGDEKYLKIFENLFTGKYGTCRETIDGFEVIIPARKAKRGVPVPFWFKRYMNE